ncbi:hypothetical protein N0614_09550 [Pseudomonas aeruginosa]|nr:hypothetical protein [Pseudomonas aeruginosa]
MSDTFRSDHKVNPEWLDALRAAAKHYGMSVNKFAVSALAGTMLFSSNTVESTKKESSLNTDNQRHCKQSISIYERLLNFSSENNSLAIRDLQNAFHKTGTTNKDELNEYFFQTIKTIQKDFNLITMKSKCYVDDNSKDAENIRNSLKNISIHKNAPKVKNLILRLPTPMKIRFFRGKPESKNPKFRRALQQYIVKNIALLSYEISPETLLFLDSVNNRINNLNHLLNSTMQEGRKTGLSTFIAEMTSIKNEITNYGVKNVSLL